MSWKNLKVRFVHIFCTTFQFAIQTWSLKRINESKRYFFVAVVVALDVVVAVVVVCTFLRKHSCTLSFQPVRLCCCCCRCCCCSCWFTICILHFCCCCCSMRKKWLFLCFEGGKNWEKDVLLLAPKTKMFWQYTFFNQLWTFIHNLLQRIF